MSLALSLIKEIRVKNTKLYIFEVETFRFLPTQLSILFK